jgi:hypothetical protein
LRIILQRMAFTPEQNLQIAAAYGKAAIDYTVPPQHRKAFARKAEWFRMVARVAAKRVAAKQSLRSVPPKEHRASDNSHTGLQLLSKARHLFAWQRYSLTELKR